MPKLSGEKVILISIDTLRADHLGCYGYERDTSPNIDALADDSFVFSNTTLMMLFSFAIVMEFSIF